MIARRAGRYLVSSALLLFINAGAADGDEPVDAEKPKPFVVAELFTSQGCSSCPPADAVLKKLRDSTDGSKVDLVVLSLHVDYWNRLGWTDPYSFAAITERQSAYAESLKLDGLFTPQLIVNGARSLVGSRENDARKAVAEATKETDGQTAIRFKLKVVGSNKIDGDVEPQDQRRRPQIRRGETGSKSTPAKNSGGESSTERRAIDVEYEIETPDGVEAPTDLTLMLTQSEGTRRVTKGENRGERLSHVEIVRRIEVRKLAVEKGKSTGRWRVETPATSKEDARATFAVTGLLRRTETMEITGVARIAVDGEPRVKSEVKSAERQRTEPTKKPAGS
jgi:hypothetical protein